MTGSTPSTSKLEYYSENGIPWVTPTDIDTLTISNTPRKLSEEGMKVGRVVPANTILCTCIASIGKNALLTVKGSFNQQINSLTPSAENDSYFLLTESELWSEKMKRMAASGTMQIVNKTEFSELVTMVPSLDEQKIIGFYFRNIDHLITLHQRKYLQKKKVSLTWEQRKLGDLVKEGILEAPLDGNHGEKHPTSDEYVDSGIPFLMASDIHNGEVNIYSCKYITKERAERLDKGFARNGDVLLTHKATIGETAILSKLTTKYAMLTPQVTYYRIKNEERLNREYLYSFFNSLDFQTELKTKAAQSTRPYIGITAQQNLRIILPKEIDEQRKIGLYFRNLDHLITLHQSKCENLKNLKKYMLRKMFV